MPAVDDQTKLAFDYVRGAVAQMITLSTAILTLEVTFIKSIIPTSMQISADTQAILVWSWVLFVVSLFFGILALLALAGAMGRPDPSSDLIYRNPIRLYGLLQVCFFIIAVGLTVRFASLVSFIPVPKV